MWCLPDFAWSLFHVHPFDPELFVILPKQRLVFHAEPLDQWARLFPAYYSVVIEGHRNCCIPHLAILCSSPVPTLPCLSFPWTGITAKPSKSGTLIIALQRLFCTAAQHRVKSPPHPSLSTVRTALFLSMLSWKKKKRLGPGLLGLAPLKPFYRPFHTLPFFMLDSSHNYYRKTSFFMTETTAKPQRSSEHYKTGQNLHWHSPSKWNIKSQRHSVASRWEVQDIAKKDTDVFWLDWRGK